MLQNTICSFQCLFWFCRRNHRNLAARLFAQAARWCSGIQHARRSTEAGSGVCCIAYPRHSYGALPPHPSGASAHHHALRSNTLQHCTAAFKPVQRDCDALRRCWDISSECLLSKTILPTKKHVVEIMETPPPRYPVQAARLCTGSSRLPVQQACRSSRLASPLKHVVVRVAGISVRPGLPPHPSSVSARRSSTL